MTKSYLPRLQHILQAVQDIRQITNGRELADLQRDRLHILALERSFEIISEASRHLPDALKARHADIPWRQVAGIGNILRHEYDAVAPRLL